MVTVCVYGLWHLGCVTAACLAAEGQAVVGLDRDTARVGALRAGQPPIAEPGLAELVRAGLASGRLTFTTEPAEALAAADVLWVAFDTPVDAEDRADVAWMQRELDTARAHVRPHTLVVVSSQVPVGFTGALERAWRASDPTLQAACVPENLRLGQAIQNFQHMERVVCGVGAGADRGRLERLLAPRAARVEWMSLASAEMTKHALNAFLAAQVAYTNELARICERVGADATEVERGLRSEPRVGPRAYVSPGPPLAGGTLVRDVGFLSGLAAAHGVPSPFFDAILQSDRLHRGWLRERLQELLADEAAPRVALLGLTYKPDTDTLRRSAAVELAHWLVERGATVRAYDPAICVPPHALPPELADASGRLTLAPQMAAALAGADVAVLTTAWPQFRALTPDLLVRAMRRPRLLDQAGFLPALADDPRVEYIRVGRPRSATAEVTA